MSKLMFYSFGEIDEEYPLIGDSDYEQEGFINEELCSTASCDDLQEQEYKTQNPSDSTNNSQSSQEQENSDYGDYSRQIQVFNNYREKKKLKSDKGIIIFNINMLDDDDKFCIKAAIIMKCLEFLYPLDQLLNSAANCVFYECIMNCLVYETYFRLDWNQIFVKSQKFGIQGEYDDLEMIAINNNSANYLKMFRLIKPLIRPLLYQVKCYINQSGQAKKDNHRKCEKICKQSWKDKDNKVNFIAQRVIQKLSKFQYS